MVTLPLVLGLWASLAGHATAATFSVSNSSPSSPGSLRQAILDSNGSGGSNTLQWSATGGDIPPSIALPTFTTPMTFNVATATSEPIISDDLNIGPGLTVNGQMTMNGVVSGAGALNKTLPSTTLTLTATNTYTGGTVVTGAFDSTIAIYRDNNLGDPSSSLTLNGGRLAIFGHMTSSRTISVNGSSTIDTGMYGATLSGGISGTGQFFKMGFGTLTVNGSISVPSGLGVTQGYMVLAGSNTYGSSTIIGPNGSLGVYNDSNLGDSFIINQGGKFILLSSATITKSYNPGYLGTLGQFDTNGFDVNYAGSLASTFTFVKTGSGTLTISGDNSSYIGGVRLDAGFLTATSTSALGTGALTLNGGGFVFSSTQPLVNNVVLAATSATVNDSGLNATITATASGSGHLIKLGSGTLSLNGTNTFSGGTTIAAGTLRLGSASGVMDNSNLAVLDQGTFALNGFSKTLGQVANDGTIDLGVNRLDTTRYSGSGTLSTVISGATTYGTLTAGSADLSATTLQISLHAFTPEKSSTFAIIASTAVTGQLAGIISPAAQQFIPIYDATGVRVTALDIPYAAIASGESQSQTAMALDRLRYQASGDMSTVISQLNALDSNRLKNSLTQIGPSVFGGLSAMAAPATSAQTMAVSNRLTALRSGASDRSLFTYAHVIGKQWYPGIPTAQVPGDVNPTPMNKMSPWGFYAALLGSIGRMDARNGSPGFDLNAQGSSFGVDYRFSPSAAIGGTLGYVRSHSGADDGGGTIDGDSIKYGLYGTLKNDGWYADAYLGGAEDFYKSRRTIVVLSRSANSNTGARQFNGKASIGHELLTSALVFCPSLSLSYDHQVVAAFTESGSGALDLAVHQQVIDSLKTAFGLKTSRTFSRWTPFVSGAWQYELRTPSRPITAQFNGNAGGTFSSMTPAIGRNAALVSAGVEAAIARNLMGRVSYNGEYLSGWTNHSLNGYLRLRY